MAATNLAQQMYVQAPSRKQEMEKVWGVPVGFFLSHLINT